MNDAVVRCHAHNRKGEQCGHPAGWGTEHVGTGLCRLHGGNSPSGKTSAAREQVTAMAAAMGDGIDADPFDTILAAIRQAWAEVRLFGELAAENDGPLTEDGYLHPAVKQRQYAMDRAVKYAQIAIQAGVSERQVRVAEQMGEQFGAMLHAVAEQLGLSSEQRALLPAIVERVTLEGVALDG